MSLFLFEIETHTKRTNQKQNQKHKQKEAETKSKDKNKQQKNKKTQKMSPKRCCFDDLNYPLCSQRHIEVEYNSQRPIVPKSSAS